MATILCILFVGIGMLAVCWYCIAFFAIQLGEPGERLVRAVVVDDQHLRLGRRGLERDEALEQHVELGALAQVGWHDRERGNGHARVIGSARAALMVEPVSKRAT